MLICEHGHQNEEYREEIADANEQILLGHTKRLKNTPNNSKRKGNNGKRQALKPSANNNDSLLVEQYLRGPSSKLNGTNLPIRNDSVVWEGSVEAFLINLGFQCLLKAQLEALGKINPSYTSEAFKANVRNLWLFYVDACFRNVTFGTTRRPALSASLPTIKMFTNRTMLFQSSKFSLSITLVVLHIAAKHTGLPVMLKDLMEWVKDGALPLLQPTKYVPPALIQRLPGGYKHLFRSKGRGIPCLDTLQTACFRLIHLWYIYILQPLNQNVSENSPLNMQTCLGSGWAYCITERLLGECSLPREWLPLTIALTERIAYPSALGMTPTIKVHWDYGGRYVPLEYTIAAIVLFLARLTATQMRNLAKVIDSDEMDVIDAYEDCIRQRHGSQSTYEVWRKRILKIPLKKDDRNNLSTLLESIATQSTQSKDEDMNNEMRKENVMFPYKADLRWTHFNNSGMCVLQDALHSITGAPDLDGLIDAYFCQGDKSIVRLLHRKPSPFPL